jgi:hypothetical protein
MYGHAFDLMRVPFAQLGAHPLLTVAEASGMRHDPSVIQQEGDGMFAIVLFELPDVTDEVGATSIIERGLASCVESAGFKLIGSAASDSVEDLPAGQQIWSRVAQS